MSWIGPAPSASPPGPASTGPQAHINCSGCRTLLAFPAGAQNVRCARCGQISAVPPAAGSDMAQLVCSSPQCRIVLMYPRGASQVQCSVCNTVNCAMAANQVGHVVCGLCQITLMYAWGAQSVKCAVCNHVTPVDTAAAPPSLPARQPKMQSVVVENPPDEHGNPNVAIGIFSPKE